MAIVSIFTYMKKYQLPKPLWIISPALGQQDPGWNMLALRTVKRNFDRFYTMLSAHDKNLYRKLFPLPFDWDDLKPKGAGAVVPEEAFVTEHMLRLHRWTPMERPLPEITEQDCVQVQPEDISDWFSPVNFHTFDIALNKDSFYSQTVSTVNELLAIGYALYRGYRKQYMNMYEGIYDEALWQDFLKKAKRCRTDSWLNILPHLLGVGLYRQFTQNPNLRIALQETGNRPIVYMDPSDMVLGGAFKDGKFCGENLYGKALMQVRSELNRVYDNIVLCKALETPKDDEDSLKFPFD